jgi:hypothetical protein
MWVANQHTGRLFQVIVGVVPQKNLCQYGIACCIAWNCCYTVCCIWACRDVHKEFKKRGYSVDQLQAGLMVCRPCHSAIHRAVPDNKQLAVHYSTAEALSQVGGRGRLGLLGFCGVRSTCYPVRASGLLRYICACACQSLLCMLLPVSYS